MLRRSLLALIASLVPLTGQAESARYLGSFVWTSADERFGGFSGLDISEDGRHFYALSDRANLFSGTLTRTENGAVSAAQIDTIQRLKSNDGIALGVIKGDSEGFALAPNGTAYVSFEGKHRVAKLSLANGQTVDLKGHPDFAKMQANSSLEAIAVDASGAIFTLPERSGAMERPFPSIVIAPGQAGISHGRSHGKVARISCLSGWILARMGSSIFWNVGSPGSGFQAVCGGST